jgi:hypothetical protein
MVQLLLDRGKQPILFNVPQVNEAVFPPSVVEEIHGKRDQQLVHLRKRAELQLQKGEPDAGQNAHMEVVAVLVASMVPRTEGAHGPECGHQPHEQVTGLRPCGEPDAHGHQNERKDFCTEPTDSTEGGSQCGHDQQRAQRELQGPFVVR